MSSVFVPGQDLPTLQADQNVFWELFNVGNGMYILYFRVNVACTVRFSINIRDPPTDAQPSPAARILLNPQIMILPGIISAHVGVFLLIGFLSHFCVRWGRCSGRVSRRSRCYKNSISSRPFIFLLANEYKWLQRGLQICS